MSKAERFYMRVGLVVGPAGFVLVALGQLVWAFAAVLLLGVVALVAGLATAKWLPRALYGKQLITGVRAGAVACGIASLALLVSPLLAGHASIDILAPRSHLLGFQLESAAHALRFLGWFGVALLLALAGSAIGTPVAGVAAQLAAWDKNQRAIQVINRAREAAQRSADRNPLGAPYSGQARRPSSAVPVFPVYPPIGQGSPDSARARPDAAPQQGASHDAVLHDALAAWADGANRPSAPDVSTRTDRSGDRASRPASDRDNWLC